MKGFLPVYLMLLLCAAVWAFCNIAFKIVFQQIDPVPFFAIRGLVACATIVGFVALREKHWRLRRADIPRLVVLGLAGITGSQLVYMLGLDRTSAANASLLNATSPVFGLILGSIVDHEHSSPRQWSGVFLALLGAALIILGGGQDQLSFGLESLGGDLIVLVAAVSWSIYAVLGRHVLKRYSAAQLTAYSWLVGVFAGLPIAAQPLLAQHWAELTTLSWAIIVFAGIIVPLTTMIWNRSVSRIGAPTSLLFIYLVPVFTVIFAILILGEVPSLLQVVGGAVVLTGVYVARRV